MASPQNSIVSPLILGTHIHSVQIVDGFKETYVSFPETDFVENIRLLHDNNYDLVSLFCVESFEGTAGFTLFYVFEHPDIQDLYFVHRHLASMETTSVALIFPSASWYEREIQDGFGIDIMDTFDKRHLFLHEIYPDNFHPLRKKFQNQSFDLSEVVAPEKEYKFMPITGVGVYQIPVGPVHAGVIEPGPFRFSVIGETIYNLEIRHFYKHRGIEKLAEGKDPHDVVSIAEAISGDETVANAVAFCTAVE